MALDGQIRLKRTTITKRIGQLFVDRASINLHSDILDHPEFFWEDDECAPTPVSSRSSGFPHARIHI